MSNHPTTEIPYMGIIHSRMVGDTLGMRQKGGVIWIESYNYIRYAVVYIVTFMPSVSRIDRHPVGRMEGEDMTSMNQSNSNRPAVAGAANATNILHRQLPGTTTGMVPKFVPTLSEDDAISQARLLKALADPTRLRILSLLSRHEGEVCVFEIVESFTLEQPTISHHLRILRDAGLVDCRKKGLWAYYYVRREALGRARDVIEGLA